MIFEDKLYAIHPIKSVCEFGLSQPRESSERASAGSRSDEPQKLVWIWVFLVFYSFLSFILFILGFHRFHPCFGHILISSIFVFTAPPCSTCSGQQMAEAWMGPGHLAGQARVSTVSTVDRWTQLNRRDLDWERIRNSLIFLPEIGDRINIWINGNRMINNLCGFNMSKWTKPFHHIAGRHFFGRSSWSKLLAGPQKAGGVKHTKWPFNRHDGRSWKMMINRCFSYWYDIPNSLITHDKHM